VGGETKEQRRANQKVYRGKETPRLETSPPTRTLWHGTGWGLKEKEPCRGGDQGPATARAHEKGPHGTAVSIWKVARTFKKRDNSRL